MAPGGVEYGRGGGGPDMWHVARPRRARGDDGASSRRARARDARAVTSREIDRVGRERARAVAASRARGTVAWTMRADDDDYLDEDARRRLAALEDAETAARDAVMVELDRACGCEVELASGSAEEARTWERRAGASAARARTGRALERAVRACASVSELEDEDGALVKLERAVVSVGEGAAAMAAASGADGTTGETTGEADLGVESCDVVRETTWRAVLQMRLRAAAWPPGLRPSDLRDLDWSLRTGRRRGDETTASEDDETGAARAVRALRVLRDVSRARAIFAGDESFAQDDVALAFAEDLTEALRRTFATTGSLSDPRKPERLFACAKELIDKTPAIVRAELDRSVFADDPKGAVATARHYLSLLVHSVSDILQTHVCVACASSDDPWWLHLADECRAFDDHVSKSPYATFEETPKTLDALVLERANAEAWLDAEREHVTSRASKSWADARNWVIKSCSDADVRAPRVAHDVVTELKSALECSRGLSRPDWRLYFVNRVITPLLEDFWEECESRAVGSKGLGSLVASTGSWRSGTSGAMVVAAAVNACAFVADALRALAEETYVLEFGGESCLESHASKFEKFNARWIEAIADAATSQFTDKMLGDAFAGSPHLRVYERVEDDQGDDEGARHASASEFILAALGALRERVEDARSALEGAAFEKCRRAMASKTARVIVDRVVCVATFSRAGAKQLDLDRMAHLDVFATAAPRERSSALRSKTKILDECVAALSCDVAVARELAHALRSDGIKGLATINARKSELKISKLDDALLLRVLSRRADARESP